MTFSPSHDSRLTIHGILKRYWGYDSFRPQQQEIIESVLAGKDTLALLPTGGGKSICYQVPALAQDGICLVVSPLIALMKDQVENLKKRGIGALAIYSGMQRNDIVRTLENARQKYFKFLYVSPERLETSLFKEYLPALNINLIAVDEAHCISQWGYDFRPSYLRIAELRKELPDVPVLAVTASATVEVQKDICEKLTSPLTPLRQSRRGESLVQSSYPRYQIADIVQFENARKNRKQSTEAEKNLWGVLRDKQTGYKFRRQHPIENFIVDFACIEKRLIIEVDGDYHYSEEQKEYDNYRSQELYKKGFIVLRFTNQQVLNNPFDVKNKIKEFIKTNEKSLQADTAPLSSFAGEGLGMRWSIFHQSFERKNLSYSVFRVESKINKVIDIIKKVSGTSIVYCKSRKRTNEIANLLQMHGISAENYHAGLPQDQRAKRQQDWIDNKTRVIVCTNAFGMGIDKPDVRTVIHVDIPDCLENYYQEAGRCGRDGKKAYAVLLYDDRDIKELSELHLQRYPSFEEIKNVYKSLVNFLQIPNHSGEDQLYGFRFDDFVRNFKLNVHHALYALKALEQDGWIEYNEKNFTPSTALFTSTKEHLYGFYKSHPEYENVCVALLRTYEGIFDFPAFISESLLSKLLQAPFDDVKKQLKEIAAFGIIKYTAQNDEPQIIFRKDRVAADDLTIDLSQYQKRKEVFIQRVTQMIGYTQSNKCRSWFISNYFGENDSKKCGVCDNCLRNRSLQLSPEEFDTIASSITKHLSERVLTVDELLMQMRQVKKEKTWKVLEFLQSEKKIFADSKGYLKIA